MLKAAAEEAEAAEQVTGECRQLFVATDLLLLLLLLWCGATVLVCKRVGCNNVATRMQQLTGTGAFTA
jgi:hypothetical protein